MPLIEGTHKFIGSCPRCDQIRRAMVVNVGSKEYPDLKWVDDDHEYPGACIIYLRDRIEALEQKGGV